MNSDDNKRYNNSVDSSELTSPLELKEQVQALTERLEGMAHRLALVETVLHISTSRQGQWITG